MTTPDPLSLFPLRLREARERSGLSLEQLVERSTVRLAWLRWYESEDGSVGGRLMKVQDLLPLCRALSTPEHPVTPNWLLGWEETT